MEPPNGCTCTKTYYGGVRPAEARCRDWDGASGFQWCYIDSRDSCSAYRTDAYNNRWARCDKNGIRQVITDLVNTYHSIYLKSPILYNSDQYKINDKNVEWYINPNIMFLLPSPIYTN